MQLWGLTGGIASGKSTVSRMFRQLGAVVLDADAIYHQLLMPQNAQPSPLVAQIAGHFPHVLGPQGTLDRQALGAQVFSDPNARQRLNSIAHPAIAKAFAQQVQLLSAQGIKNVIYDVPLLFENQMQNKFVAVVLVWIDARLQEQRLMQRNQLDRQEAKRRIGTQMPLETKKALADFVIDNSGNSTQTLQQVEKLWHHMRQQAP